MGEKRNSAETSVSTPALQGLRSTEGTRLSKITDRQLEVLSLAALHLENKLIADRLGIQERTVEAHLEKAGRTLGVHGKNAIVREYLSLTNRFGNPALGTPQLDHEQPVDDIKVQELLAKYSSISKNPLAGLEAFDAKHGVKGRIFLIAISFVGLLLCLLVATSVLQEVSGLLSASP